MKTYRILSLLSGVILLGCHSQPIYKISGTYTRQPVGELNIDSAFLDTLFIEHNMDGYFAEKKLHAINKYGEFREEHYSSTLLYDPIHHSLNPLTPGIDTIFVDLKQDCLYINKKTIQIWKKLKQ